MRVGGMAAGVYDPPVAEAKAWVAGRTFAADHPLLDLSQAVPAHPPAPELRAHLAELVRRDDTAAYAPAIGLPDTRAAVADRLGVASDHVMITAGCNQAFCLAIGVLCAPGDNVVLPAPHYFNHDMWLRANGIEVRADSPEHPARIDDRTRAIVLVTPNNPTGATASPTTIAERFELARAHGIALVLDETYAEFRHDSEPAHDLFTRDDWPDTLVRLHSFSKVFALAGYRVGSLVAHPELLRDAVKLADCQTIGAPRIAQHAAAWGLAHLDDWVAARRAEMLAKVDACAAAFAGSLAGTGWELESAGAYFAWIRHPFTGEPARTVARRLADEQALLTIPGECFGTDQDAFVRLAFGNVDLAAVPEVARRLAASTA